ncbi:MAG: phosphoesterase [Chthoniobacterales bacterium]|nr:MAG: phosphoesterase [Chthoniobacterales bacterium]
MNVFDEAIMSFLNRAAQASPGFDQFVVFLSNSDLVKGGAVAAVVWAAWFYRGGDQNENRSFLLSAVLGALVALFIARVFAHWAPMRIRPVLDPQLHFRSPSGLPAQSNWTSWSSFPSDHAALFFALAMGVWWVWRKGGTALSLYVALVICLPRLYLGIHYPTDVLAGAAIGLGSVALLSNKALRSVVAEPILNWGERHPVLFYFSLSLLIFQIATLFWDIRVALSLFDISV